MKPRTAGIAALSFTAITLAGSAAGVHINYTDSAPHGIWLVRPLNNDVKRGSWVSICPPIDPVTRAVAELNLLPLGDCPILKVAPLLKPVGAVPGDVVRLYNERSVTVNGKTLPNTVSKTTLPPFPAGEYIVRPGEVWIFSDYSPNSFDSRYFGPVRISQVRGKAIPFITSEDL